MKICVMSDLHGFLIDNIEPCELVLICGDIIPLRMQRNIPQSEKWLKTKFAEWINNLPCTQAIMVGGNHDFALANMYENYLKKVEVLYGPTKYKLVMLDNDRMPYNFEGKEYSIWGTPYCKPFGNWAYMYEPETLIKEYATMPTKCDIVLTHDAPKLCGLGEIKKGYHAGTNAGNPWLADEIMRKHPKYVFCGHIHSGEHTLQTLDDINMVNVSIVDEYYGINYNPLYLDI